MRQAARLRRGEVGRGTSHRTGHDDAAGRWRTKRSGSLADVALLLGDTTKRVASEHHVRLATPRPFREK